MYPFIEFPDKPNMPVLSGVLMQLYTLPSPHPTSILIDLPYSLAFWG